MPHVFGYGSLVDRGSLEGTLGRVVAPADGPHPVRLRGYRRAWNSANHNSVRGEYLLHGSDGAVWAGWLVFLGLEPADGDAVLGAVSTVTEAELALLDRREVSYDRVDVRDRLDRDVPGVGSEPVHAFVPKPEARERARRAGAAGTVMARYLRLVDRAYRGLGDDLYAEHLATMPPTAPFTVLEITATPVGDLRSWAVDPAAE